MQHRDIYAALIAGAAFLIGLAKSQIIAYIKGTATWLVTDWFTKNFSELLSDKCRELKSRLRQFSAGQWSRFLRFEISVMNCISAATQSPHWTFFWLIFAISWIGWRQLCSHPWYTEGHDLLVITIFWSIKPAIVEYSLKYSQGVQLKEQAKNTELLTSLLKLNLEMCKRIISKVDFISNEIGEDDDKPIKSDTE